MGGRGQRSSSGKKLSSNNFEFINKNTKVNSEADFENIAREMKMAYDSGYRNIPEFDGVMGSFSYHGLKSQLIYSEHSELEGGLEFGKKKKQFSILYDWDTVRSVGETTKEAGKGALEQMKLQESYEKFLKRGK